VDVIGAKAAPGNPTEIAAMYKSILAATALALAASAVPAAAYERDYQHSKGYSQGYSNKYAKGDHDRRVHTERRWWNYDRDHDDHAYRHHHHRRHWWQRYYGWNR
jgi:hypothetical protein